MKLEEAELTRKLVIGMRTSRGFTLLEILIVLLIIGITTGVALLAFGDFGVKRKARVSAEQFSSYLTLLEHEAVLDMTSYGIRILPDSYQTFRLDSTNHWQALPENSIFRRQQLPAKLTFSIQPINNRNRAPDIIINPAGEISPFRINFANEMHKNLIILSCNKNGVVSLDENHDEDR